jgi:alkanesulfonate monooxygenase SsuD/methylene tetrahydromethanopterin reductase-like flavin-dependent oxidoreductase (luciferase family)
LDWPPDPPPPVLVGAIKPRTVALAGELSDGIIFTGDTGAATVRESLAHFRAGRAAATVEGLGTMIVVFLPIAGRQEPTEIALRIAEHTDAGATHVILHSVGDGAALEDFATQVGQEVRPLVG